MVKKKLKRLYDICDAVKVPCPKGCDECCGPVPFSPEEWQEVIELPLPFPEERLKGAQLHREEDGSYVPTRITDETGEPLWCCLFKRTPEEGFRWIQEGDTHLEGHYEKCEKPDSLQRTVCFGMG